MYVYIYVCASSKFVVRGLEGDVLTFIFTIDIRTSRESMAVDFSEEVSSLFVSMVVVVCVCLGSHSQMLSA